MELGDIHQIGYIYEQIKELTSKTKAVSQLIYSDKVIGQPTYMSKQFLQGYRDDLKIHRGVIRKLKRGEKWS